MKKRLGEIVTASVKSIIGTTAIEVTGFSSDSREIKQGNLFFAIKGEQSDGNKFIPSAIKNGAGVIVSESPCPVELNAVYVEVHDIYQFMAETAALFYETANSPLTIIGVTGTNGKTTTACFIHEILKAFGCKTIFIGTTGVEINGEIFHTDYTTPPAYELHRILRKGLDLGVSHVVMEVSSHALKFKRVWGLKYDAAVFTNLTHEHREIHPTMDDYFSTKRILFSMLKNKGIGLINSDDEYGKEILKTSVNMRLLDYGHHAKDVKLLAANYERQNHSQTICYETEGKRYDFKIPMIGEYNAYNALAAAETLVGLGFQRNRIHQAFQSIPAVAGRLESYEIGGIHVLIDFAHTPDGIKKLIEAVREIRTDTAGIITVFGCPGSRDPSKRPLMGQIASELSDHVIVTTDDIHHEEPDNIIQDILNGITRNNFEKVIDRREAIARGLAIAKKGDFLLIAGRGHEKFQYVKDRKIPFLDKDVLFEEAGKAGLELSK